MNASQILNKTLQLVTPFMHGGRRASLINCVSSLTKGANASVTSIGRNIHSPAQEKHRIKQADRLLSNPHLTHEADFIYAAICLLFTTATLYPVILVDWSDLDEYKRHFLLRASLVFKGRSLTLYEQVHCLKTKEKPAVHQAFLQQLKTMLPLSCKPVIVTDAGFKTPWFNMVRTLGWHYVGRARKPNFYHAGDEQWCCISTLYQQASHTPQYFEGEICRKKPMSCTFVVYRQRPRGRHKFNRSGVHSRSKHSKASASRNTDPWVIVTSLPGSSSQAKRIVNIYKTRMQIEEGFRDMKSARYGLGFSYNLSVNQARLANLILLTSLTSMVLLLTGWAVSVNHLHRRYQANSVKHKAVLSLHFIGLRATVDPWLSLTPSQWEWAISQLDYTLRDNGACLN